jgi:hypothetical protein
MPIPPYLLWEKEMVQLGLGVPVWNADPFDEYETPIEPGGVIQRVSVVAPYFSLNNVSVVFSILRDGKPDKIYNIFEQTHTIASISSSKIDSPLYTGNVSSVTLEGSAFVFSYPSRHILF